jgi:hypothetical protein
MNMLGDYIKREIAKREWDDAMRELRAMSIEQLRALWDSFDENSFCGKHDCIYVHAALNEKGDGDYCAV